MSTPAMALNQEKIPERNLQSIYKNCLDLYQTKKINNTNAFTCKLLDCLPQLIESPDFDITNMQVVGRTLEMGTKIYVCRVEDTYEMVMGLAKRVGAKSKAMERLREFSEQQRDANEDEVDDVELGDNELDAHGQPLYAKEKKTREKRKCPGRFVASKDKIRMSFSEKVEKYADRQARVRELFTKVKETRQSVPYQKFESQGRKEDGNNVLKDTDEMLSTVHKFPQVFIKSDLGSKIQFLQFVWLPNNVQFDPDLYDAWGRSKQALAAVEEERQNANVNINKERGALDTIDEVGEYEFDVNAEVDYPHEPTNGIEAERFGYDGDSDREEVEPRGAGLEDLCRVKNMDQLAKFYEALRAVGAQKKSAFTWAGSNYIRARLGVSRTLTANSERKPRTKKVASPFEFDKIDWQRPGIGYDPLPPGKLELDDKCLERWKTTNLSTFSEAGKVDVLNQATYLDILSTNDNNSQQDVDKFLKYFVHPKWNIFQPLEEEKDGDSDGERNEPNEHAPMFDDDGDIDFDGGPRSQFEEGEDYCSRSMLVAGSGQEASQQPPLSGNINLDNFLSFFPAISQTESGEYEEFMGATSDSEGIKFAKQPKPINMKKLKNLILYILKQKLALDENYKSTQDEDMSIDILSLLLEVFKRADERTARFLSTSLLFLALLHVAAEIGVFLEKIPGTFENVNIIAHGKNWDHKLHIPMGISSFPAIDLQPTENRHEAGQLSPLDTNVLSSRSPSIENEGSEKENEMELDVIQELDKNPENELERFEQAMDTTET